MLKTTLSLAFIVASRYFSLFIILPVLSLYTLNLKSSNELLVGVLMGVYALTQMIFQIPFGILSDKIGRKISIIIGLVIFIMGSLICANTDDIYLMILGRFLQGCGSIGAVITAMISDFTKEEQRNKAMALVGAMIGVSFAISMILSPILSAKFGLRSLFDLSTIIAIFCIILLLVVIPKEPKIITYEDKVPLKYLFKDKNLNILNFANFLEKMFMVMVFLIMPIFLVNELGYPKNKLWEVYTIATIFGFIVMGVSSPMAEKRKINKEILLFGIILFFISFVVFIFSKNSIIFIIGIVLFFIAFNMFEPIMNSLASKFAKSHQKGSVFGLFNSSGFFGSFIGGIVGGWFFKTHQINLMFAICAIICIVWFVLFSKITNPKLFRNLYIQEKEDIDLDAISELQGIVDFYKQHGDYIIKYNSSLIDEKSILQILTKQHI